VARRIYTDEDRARVKTLLEANGGNVKRTALELGFPVMTVRDMKKKWEVEGLPAKVEAALPAVREEFVEHATRIRDASLIKYGEAVDAGKVNPKDLLLGVGILTDKVRLVSGQATSRTEANPGEGMMTVAQARELFAGVAMGIVEATRKRDSAISSALDEDVIDQEWQPAEVLALPAGRD
jgi:hypothetical protein